MFMLNFPFGGNIFPVDKQVLRSLKLVSDVKPTYLFWHRENF